MKYILIFCLLNLLTYATNAKQDTTQYSNLSYEELNSLITLKYRAGRYRDAIPFADAMVYMGQKEKNDVVLAKGLHYKGLISYRLGNYKQALKHYLYAKDIREKIMHIEHPDYASSLNDLALLHYSLGNYSQALPIYRKAIAIQKKILGNNHPDYATSLNDLGLLHEQMGNYNIALSLYSKAINIYLKVFGKEHPEYAATLHNLAVVYERTGYYDKALHLYLEVKKIEEKVLGKEHPDYAITLENLGFLYKTMANYDKALPIFLQAKNIYERTLGKEHPRYASSLYKLGDLHRNMGNYKQALPFLFKAIEIQEKSLGKENTNYASSIINLVLLHQNMGNYEQALQLLKETSLVYKKKLSREHPFYALSLNNLARMHIKLGEYEKALLLLLSSKDIFERSLSKEHPHYLVSLNLLASVYHNIGNHFEAWNILTQSINSVATTNQLLTFDEDWFNNLFIAKFSSYKHLEQMIESLRIAYELLEKDSSVLDKLEKQIKVTDLVNTLLIRARNQVSNEKDKLRILALSNEWLQKSLNLLDPEVDTEKAFKLSDQNKSVLLLQATKSELAYQLGELPDSLVWKDRKLLKKQSELQAKLLGKGSDEEKDSLRSELNDTNFEIDEFVSMIESKYPKYHKLRYQQVDMNVSDVQSLLADNAALLEYVVGDSVLHIFYVDKKNVQWSKSFVADSILKERISSLHTSLSDHRGSYEEYTENAHWFYQKLLALVLEGKSGINKLIIVPDGELGHLPFEAFLAKKAPGDVSDYRKLHYLLRDFSISYNYSAALWKENTEAAAPKNNGKVLGVAANYGIALDSSMLTVRLPTDQWKRGELSPLPAAQLEVETLRDRYEGFFAFDSLASEKTVKAMAPDFSVLHFATHGILDSERPVLSSLAFPEDNDSSESNFWEAYEISKAQLNADLVVLSACETGYGKFEQGNGMASLARAFMYAGSPALVVSLWQVSDRSTSELMRNFYDHLDGDLDKDEALRQAKLQYLESSEEVLAHPSFWAPFIMIGKTEAIELKRKNDLPIWFAGIGILALIAIGGAVWWKKAA